MPIFDATQAARRFAQMEAEHAKRPLAYRYTMAPVGEYEDGSYTLAWPKMITDMYEGAVRSFEQGRQLPRVDSEGYYAGTPRAEPLDAFNAASAAPVGTIGARATGLTRDVGDLGMFAGRGAKTADHAKLAEAERLASQGAPREKIWNDTGWFQGVDGKWRFEIDDRSASFSPTTGSFGDALNHPGLLDAYPDIMRYPTAVSDDTQHLGSFSPHKREFMVTPEGGRSSAIHEGQHAIQQAEDFAAGGNLLTGTSPGNDHLRRGAAMMLEATTEGAFGSRPQRPLLPWKREEWARDVARIEAADSKLAEGKRLLEEGRRLNQAPPPTLEQMLRNYRNLAGEAEARAVEKRLEYSPAERTARPPWLDYDVPEWEQIVRFNANDTTSAAPSLLLNSEDGQQVNTGDVARLYQAYMSR